MTSTTCPHCGNTLPIQNILQDRESGKAHGHCKQCKIWIPILLPSIHKKLVYLDQSFLSAVCLEADSTNTKNEVRILSKLTELKALQRIFVVVSDVHSRETSAIPDKHVGNRKKLWQFQNNLADGSISVDCDEVFVAQWSFLQNYFINETCRHLMQKFLHQSSYISPCSR
jgi:transcription elongation factor Elf1